MTFGTMVVEVLPVAFVRVQVVLGKDGFSQAHHNLPCSNERVILALVGFEHHSVTHPLPGAFAYTFHGQRHDALTRPPPRDRIVRSGLIREQNQLDVIRIRSLLVDRQQGKDSLSRRDRRPLRDSSSQITEEPVLSL